MKKTILMLILLLFTVAAGFAQTEAELKTVESVDLKQYSGKWFEIARYSDKIQDDCVGNTTATYNVKEDTEDIEVINECLKKNGRIEKATGEAKIKDENTNAKLEIRFAPGWLSWDPQVWGDYWIIDLDRNYRYAVVGEPTRKYFWILSREPEMNDAVYQAILRRAEANGFNPGRIYKTPQNVEVLKGEIIQKP